MNMEQAVALERPVRDLTRWEQTPSLSRSTGGRNLAHQMGKQSARKRRLVWRLPRSVLGYTVHDVAGVIGIASFLLLVYWAYTLTSRG